eukprot:2927088-Prymnesium_polylepis.1
MVKLSAAIAGGGAPKKAAPDPMIDLPKPEVISASLDEMIDKFIRSLTKVEGITPGIRDQVLSSLEPLYEPVLNKVGKDVEKLAAA